MDTQRDLAILMIDKTQLAAELTTSRADLTAVQTRLVERECPYGQLAADKASLEQVMTELKAQQAASSRADDDRVAQLTLVQERVAELETELAQARELIESGTAVTALLSTDLQAMQKRVFELEEVVKERDANLVELANDRTNQEAKAADDITELREEWVQACICHRPQLADLPFRSAPD